MRDDIKLEKVLEAIYDHITDHMPAEACESCGVLRVLEDVMLGNKE